MAEIRPSGLISPAVQVPTLRPFRSTVTRSLISSASASRCEMKTMPLPAAASARVRSNSQATSEGPSAEVASSSTTMSGSAASTLAIATSWRAATDRSRGWRVGLMPVRPMLANSSSARARIRRRATVPRGLNGWRLKKMFSITVRSGISGSSWKTTPTPAASDAPGSRGANGSSRSRTSPLSARNTPDMTLTSVDLPAPFSPSSACTSPPRTSKLTSCSACTPANALDRPFAVSSRSRWLIWLSCGIPGLLAGGRPAAGWSSRRLAEALSSAGRYGTTCAGRIVMNGGLGGSVRPGDRFGNALTPILIAWQDAPAGEEPPA